MAGDHRLVIVALATTLTAMLGSSAQASPTPGTETDEPPPHVAVDDHGHHPTREHHDPENLLGIKVIGLSAVEQPRLDYIGEKMIFGAGLFYERVFAHGMLDVEFAALACRGQGATVFPLELLLKKPFYPAPALTLYVGVGPTLDVAVIDGEVEAFPALMAVAGGYLWANRHIGLDFEVSAGHLFEHDGLHEYVLAAGPVLQF